MALLPMEVQQKTFRESMRRGYDQGEVDDFLDEIVAHSPSTRGGRAPPRAGRQRWRRKLGRLREEREAVTEALVDARRRAQAVVAEAPLRGRPGAWMMPSARLRPWPRIRSRSESGSTRSLLG